MQQAAAINRPVWPLLGCSGLAWSTDACLAPGVPQTAAPAPADPAAMLHDKAATTLVKSRPARPGRLFRAATTAAARMWVSPQGAVGAADEGAPAAAAAGATAKAAAGAPPAGAAAGAPAGAAAGAPAKAAAGAPHARAAAGAPARAAAGARPA